MTIAACYLSPEGVVLGADSTTTYGLGTRLQHFNHAQKLFEVGESGTIAVVTWGLGGLNFGSHRTLIARLSDQLKGSTPSSMEEVAKLWADLFWNEYTTALAPQRAALSVMATRPPFDPLVLTPDPTARSHQEEVAFQTLTHALIAGFCIAGYVLPNRKPEAFELVFEPLATTAPAPFRLPPAQSFWGAPALVNRLIKGCGDEVRDAILMSGKWVGTPQELDALIQPAGLAHPATVPIREAIDFTHACLLTTIKAMKFSQQPRICGGPIELAVITTDRPFRWVQHKSWDAALREG